MTARTLSAAALSPGFSDPVHQGQQVFRSVMMALSRPGRLTAIDAAGIQPPAPLTPALAAMALALADYDTPLWLDPALARTDAVGQFLKFHTGAPVVASPLEATFALVSDARTLPALSGFALGTLEHPDRSTTLLIGVDSFTGGKAVTLTGPGIETTQPLRVSPLPITFWDQAEDNTRLFPRGVDMVFAAGNEIVGLPRSTTITRSEA